MISLTPGSWPNLRPLWKIRATSAGRCRVTCPGITSTVTTATLSVSHLPAEVPAGGCLWSTAWVCRAELILRTTHYCSLRTIPAFLYPWVGIHMEHRLFPLMLASSISLRFCHQCSSYVSSRAWAIQADEDLIMVHFPTHLLSGEVELVHGSQFHPLGEWPSFRSTTEGGYGCASSGDGCLPRIRNV